MTIEIDRLVMSILGSLEVVHLLLTNVHHIVRVSFLWNTRYMCYVYVHIIYI
jgi:hypothetical protein